MHWNWTWLFDDVVVALVCLATAAGFAVSLALLLASSVWLACCAARRRRVALPRPFGFLRTPVGRAAALALVVLSFDGLYLSDGGLNAFALAVGFAAQVLMALGGLAWRGRPVARTHAAAALVWLLALVEMGAFSRLNLRFGLDRSAAVVYACRAFQQDHARLPSSLDELVPGYLPRVPRATWSVLGSFSYDASARPQLTFFSPWPHLRIYDFKADEWHHEYLPSRWRLERDRVPAGPEPDANERVAEASQGLSRGRFLSGAPPNTANARDAWKSNVRVAFARDAASGVMHGTAVATSEGITVSTFGSRTRE